MSQPAHDLPLPYGWVKEVDPATNCPFYVDTRADPPRSTWHHPYEDEQYLNEHPDVREKMRAREETATRDRDRQSKAKSSRRRHAGSTAGDADVNAASTSTRRVKKEGFVEKIKHKATGMTKEEREAARRQQAQLEQERRQAMYYQQAAYGYPPPRPQQNLLLPILGGLAGGLLLGDLLF